MCIYAYGNAVKLYKRSWSLLCRVKCLEIRTDRRCALREVNLCALVCYVRDAPSCRCRYDPLLSPESPLYSLLPSVAPAGLLENYEGEGGGAGSQLPLVLAHTQHHFRIIIVENFQESFMCSHFTYFLKQDHYFFSLWKKNKIFRYFFFYYWKVIWKVIFFMQNTCKNSLAYRH